MTRTRLTPDERRAQLLAIGSEMFADRPYDEVWIEDVAEKAGVSRGLMYHYFSSKRDFFHEIVRGTVAKVLDDTRPDPDLPPRDQILNGLDAYLTFVRENVHGVRALNRGELSADLEIRTLVDDELNEQKHRILTALGTDAERNPVLAMAVHGWIAFVRAVVVEWIDDDTLTEDQIRELCLRALEPLL